ncbi:MAG: DNA polymerase III subunit beta [Bacteroidales bacterium]|nr:DNA polymerase III subunit beta [Bacteroidales bacterium]MDY4849758.1 DNA polymerase III subunit beta [Paludibacteraceae bacterium]MCI7430163.1 DNA polymerase III subunit beta [Bacteroidales bacterium]MDD6641463.1 DNA polymerase III subunit beta [Bacteroidales bacterium]MDD6782315.1 DNA polymerase III subunit beta [Bacteroidales bacterium]
MNFIVSSTALLSHLQSIGRVINSKSSLPILENFLLKVQGNTLSLTASDLETTLVTSLEVENASGDICLAVNAKLLMDSLKEFAEQPLQFDIDEGNLAVVVKTANGNYNFIGLRGDEYPELPVLGDDAQTLTMPVEVLANGVSKAVFATADDDLRPTMTGIFFDIKPEDVTFVATDAHKLVRLKNMAVKSGVDASFILPKKPAGLLKAVIAKEVGDVEISFDQKNIAFRLPSYTMVCRQIEGRFPNYNGVIPQNNPYRLIIDRVSLMNAAKRVFAFSNQGTGLIKLAISNNQLVVSAQDIDFSTSAEETLVCQYDGNEITIGFKAPFLIDILNNINSSDVIMALADPSRAGVILPFENEADEDLLMLLMPMLLSE